MNSPRGEKLLEVEDLQVSFRTRTGVLRAVDGVALSLERGRTLCIVGESGSGKTVTSLSLMRMIEPPGRIESGRILFQGTDLLTLSEAEMDAVRGDRIGMVFQDPMTSLNPAFPVGAQVAEGLIIHGRASRDAARERAVELLSLVGIPHAERRYEDYPHQFSGGMRQRALIAAAIACSPDILIADEPTTALDVTIQAQILKLLKELQVRLNSAMILVTHDLGVVAAMADEVIVMYAGRVVEYAPVEVIFADPQHPYTQGLMRSVISLDDTRDTPMLPIPGVPPHLSERPSGCSFAPRCERVFDRCRAETPVLVTLGRAHQAACHLVETESAFR